MIVMKIEQKEYRLIQRTTNRYGPKGSLTNNQGYLMVTRDPKTGRFQRKTWLGNPAFRLSSTINLWNTVRLLAISPTGKIVKQFSHKLVNFLKKGA